MTRKYDENLHSYEYEFFWPIVVIVFDQVNDRIIATDMNDALLSILYI